MVKLAIPNGTWLDALRRYGEVWMYLDENLVECGLATKNSNVSNRHMFSLRSIKDKHWEVTRFIDHIEVRTFPETYEILLALKYGVKP